MFVGQNVTTPYGLGKVSSLGETDIITVEPLTWQMAGGQVPKFYMNKKDVKAVPKFVVGDSVTCSFGSGIVREVRVDEVYVVTLTNWQLANGSIPFLYLQESALMKAKVFAFAVGDKVTCSFGKGVVRDARHDGVYVVTLTNWQLANGSIPYLYLQESAIKKQKVEPKSPSKGNKSAKAKKAPQKIYKFAAGDKVTCSFGSGVVKEARSDGVYVVTLTNWQLANGSIPYLYLQESALSFDDKALKLEADERMRANFERNIARAAELKEEAGALFKEKNYEKARIKYFDATNQIQGLGDQLTNEQKAAVLEQMVTSFNNVALCELNLKKYKDAIVAANNSKGLIEGLEKKIPDGEVWKALLKRGVTREKLNDWKKKSYFYMGKASVLKKDNATAITYLQVALKLATVPGDVASMRELLAKAKQQRDAEKKRQEAFAKTAFKESAAQAEAEEAAALEAQRVEAAHQAQIKASAARAMPNKGILDPKDLKIDFSDLGIGVKGGASAKDDDDDAKKASNDQVGFPATNDTFLTWLGGFGVFGLLGLGTYFLLRKKFR